jgi:hypothetical protein
MIDLNYLNAQEAVQEIVKTTPWEMRMHFGIVDVTEHIPFGDIQNQYNLSSSQRTDLEEFAQRIYPLYA